MNIFDVKTDIESNNRRFFGRHPPLPGQRTSPCFRVDGYGEPIELYRIVDNCREAKEGVVLFDELGPAGIVDASGNVKLW